MQALRLVISLPVAAAVTFGLFAVMQYLVSGQDGFKDDEIRTASIDFVRVKRDETANLKDRKLPNKPEPKQAPPLPPMNMAQSEMDMNSMGSDIAMPDMSSDMALSGVDLSGVQVDQDVLPLVRVPPQYPSRAASRRKEGWVVVEFSISKTGTVFNPVVVKADPPKTFNRAALKSIKKWKYKPKLVDGQPVERHGVQQLITFELQSKKKK